MSGNVVQRVPHLGHFGDQHRKKAVQTNFKKSQKNLCQKTQMSYENGLLVLGFCLVFGVHFSSFFGPGSHLAAKAPKVRKMTPECHQKVTKMTPET